MLYIDLVASADSFIKTLNANGVDSEKFFTDSQDQLIKDLGKKLNSWKSISTDDPFDESAITQKNIFESIDLVNKYLTSKFENDSDIDFINSRLTTEFYNSIKDFNDKELADLMVVFLNHFTKIAYFLENSSDADLEKNKEKVKNNLIIFPGIYSNQVEFACIEGTSTRIQEASLAFQSLPLDQQLYQDHVLELSAKLAEKENAKSLFPNSSVRDYRQIHLGPFLHSLFTINHQHLDQFYRAPDEDISLYDALQITREFKAEIKNKINKLIQEIASDADLTTKSFYQESDDNIEHNSLNQYLETLKEKYRIELITYDLLIADEDEVVYSSQILKAKLKTSAEIQQLILQKLVEKFPQLSLIDDTERQSTEMVIETLSSPIASSSTALTLQQDQFDFLAQLDIQKKIGEDRYLSLNPKKIDDILALLFPVEVDPNQSQKIKAGLLITHILARDLKNQDPIFFMALYLKIIDRINETLSDETSQKITNLKNSFKHFSRSLSQSLTQEDQIGLTNLLFYLDDKYICYQNSYFGNDSNTKSKFETYLKIYMSSEDDPLYLTTQENTTLQNNHRDFIKIALEINHYNFFISLLKFVTTYHNISSDDPLYKNLIKDFLTAKYIQGKNIIETAVEVGNFRLFMLMLDKVDEQQISEMIRDPNSSIAIANGINLCYQNNQFDFIKSFMDKIFSNDPDNEFKIRLLQTQYDENRRNLLHKLLIYGNDQIYEAILSIAEVKNKILLLKSKNNHNSTLLHLACEFGRAEVLKILFEDLNPDQKFELLKLANNDKLNPLHLACGNGNVEVIKILLADLERDKLYDLFKVETFQKLNPLHLACGNGHAEVLKILFEDLNPDQKFELLKLANNDKLNPLHLACGNGNVEVIKILLADLEQDQLYDLFKVETFQKLNPLHLACQNGHVEVIKILLADLEQDQLYDLLTKKAFKGFTPLHIACENGNADIVKILLEGLKPDQLYNLFEVGTFEKFTSFHIACFKGNVEIIEKLLEGLEPDQLYNLLIKKGIKGFTPLHLACQEGHVKVIEKLFKILPEKKFDLLNQRDKNLSNPLHIACYYGHVEVLEILLAGLENNQKFELLKLANNDKRTPLHYACQEGHAEVVKILLEDLKDDQKLILLEQVDVDGFTPLHLAFREDQAEVIEKLLEVLEPYQLYKLLKAEADKGFTPLHLACKNGNVKVVEKLLTGLKDNGIYQLLDLTNNEGLTPHDLAKQGNHSQVVKILSGFLRSSPANSPERQAKNLDRCMGRI